MINYEAKYEVGSRPNISKIFTATSGEQFSMAINFENTEDKEAVSAELIYQHLNNCIQYIQDKSEDLRVIQLDEPVGAEPWPAVGWFELLWANNELCLWWNYIYFKEEQPNATMHISESGHSHDENSDHTHDPETGEEIPNA
jgi:hypothetical protein